MSTISKAEMLAKIVESGEIPFRIKYVRTSKKKEGTVAYLTCYYGAPKPREKQSDQPYQSPIRRSPRKTHLESNSIPLTEYGTGRMLTPFISHIIEFNGKQVIH
jgi:hypothetical protein